MAWNCILETKVLRKHREKAMKRRVANWFFSRLYLWKECVPRLADRDAEEKTAPTSYKGIAIRLRLTFRWLDSTFWSGIF